MPRSKKSPWATMESAPRDGSWFYVLMAAVNVKPSGRALALPQLLTVRRSWSSPEKIGEGYWYSTYDHSIADSQIAGGRWAPLAALPLHEILEESRARGRSEHELPTPFGPED